MATWPPTPTPGTAFTSTSNNKAELRWGTDGFFGALIVKSIKSHDIIEKIDIQNGTGIDTYRILLWQGRELEFTVIDNASQGAPAPNAVVSIVSAVAGLIDPMDSGTYTFCVIDNDYNAAAKQPGERVIKAICQWNIDNAGVVPTVAVAVWPGA